MALIHGMLCMNCEKEPARPDSHYCSARCSAKFVKRTNGPVQCDHCFAEMETPQEARKAGWTHVSPSPEGISFNYGGVCPDCAEAWMSNDREPLDCADALEMLPSGNAIRTSMEPLPGTIVVATWTRRQVRELFKRSKPEKSGPVSSEHGYGIAVVRRGKPTLFIQTRIQD